MPVYSNHIETERFPFVFERFQCDKVLGKIGYTQIITVHDSYQIVQPIVGRKHRCFPDRAFVTLTVSEKGKGILARMNDCWTRMKTGTDKLKREE